MGLLLAGQVLAAGIAGAQDTTSRPMIAPPPSQRPIARDTLHQLKPLSAFFHSVLIPGWGQAKLDRKLTAGLFMGWEGLTLGMSLKVGGEVRYLDRIGADSTQRANKRQERQDWLVLLAFNHLFAGLEAFVSSHLQDFPADVRLRAAPRGIGLQAIVPFRLP
ncbi:MAG TPA: hypothetical protein VGQ73_03130 [Gemmatimonadales bacterium]|nr:hypothetical protein [Gemmatimonadales bacterium]